MAGAFGRRRNVDGVSACFGFGHEVSNPAQLVLKLRNIARKSLDDAHASSDGATLPLRLLSLWRRERSLVWSRFSPVNVIHESEIRVAICPPA